MVAAKGILGASRKLFVKVLVALPHAFATWHVCFQQTRPTG